MIPQGSTPIKNDILIEIFAKGKLNLTEIRIISYIIRWSWGFDSKDGRQKWTRSTSITKISKDINLDRTHCSRVVSGMIKEGKLLKKGSQYQFNEHYENWLSGEMDGVAGLQHFKALPNCNSSVANYAQISVAELQQNSVANYAQECSQIGTVVLPITHTQPQTDIGESKADSNPKETIKETIKEKKNKEKEKTANQLPVKISFNRKIFKFENIPKEKLAKWKEVYAALDVEKEIRKMEVWIAANPNRNKKNLERFITNWLARAEEKGGRSETNRRYFGLTKKFTREEEERLDVIQSARAGEW